MIGIAGIWFDGITSERRPAKISVAGAAICVLVEGRQVTAFQPLADLRIAERLGNTPRRLHFPDGGLFETEENDAVDRLLATHGRQGWLHRLESRWHYAAIASVLLVAIGFASVRWGIPAAAKVAATAVPSHVGSGIDAQVVKLFDQQMLAPSSLPEATQQRLQAQFRALAPSADNGLTLKVLFRNAESTVGPNAFALPGGTIVFTDQLVNLAENDTQLLAVYAHEAGHVAHRHALRQTMQASLLSLLAVTLTGDLSSVSTLITTLPLTLTQLGYSRDFEREADGAAVAALKRNGLDPEEFAQILQRLEAWHRCELPRGERAPPCTSAENKGTFDSYLTTHPPTAERVGFVRSQR